MLNFYVGQQLGADAKFPCIRLSRSNWDDFSFKTSFYAYFYRSHSDKEVELGTVKIAKIGQGFGRTELNEHFTKLGEEYFSLGQSDGYYETLSKIGK